MSKGKNLEAIISIAGEIDPSLAKSIAQASNKFGKLSKTAKIVGAVGAAGIVAIGVGVGKATTELVKLGEKFQEASNVIRIGTGATGEALEELNNDMKEVYKDIPTNLDSASQAIADYNTRLGLSGEPLQELSKQAILIEKTLGEDLSSTIESSSKAFQQWNIDTSDMTEEMDYIFKVSQSTGAGFNSLMSDMQSNGAVLQQLNFGFDESAALLGNLEKSGINTTQVMKGLKKGLSNVAEEGGDVSETLGTYVKQIKNATNESEALTIASDIFGTATASTMVQAIQSGAMDVDELTKGLQDCSETINAAAEDTYTLKDRWQMIQNSALTSLEPIGSEILKTIENLTPMLGDAIEQILPVITEMGGILSPMLEECGEQLIPTISNALQEVIPIISQMIPTISNMFGQLLPTIMSIIGEVSPMISEILGMLLPVITSILQELYPIISGLIPVISKILSTTSNLLKAILPLIQNLISTILPIIVSVLNEILPIVGKLLEAIDPIIEILIMAISEVVPTFIELLNTLSPIISFLANLIVSVLGSALNGIMDIFENVKNVLNGIITFLRDIFTGNWSNIWNDLVNIVSGVFGLLASVVKTPLNAVITAVNRVIDGINTVKSKVPGVKDIGGNIPYLPALATGGFTEGTSIAGEDGTEAVISFKPSVRKQNISYWAKAGQMLGMDESYATILETGISAGGTNNYYNIEGISFNPTIVVQGNASKEDIDKSISEQREEFFDRLDEWWEEKTGGGGSFDPRH